MNIPSKKATDFTFSFLFSSFERINCSIKFYTAEDQRNWIQFYRIISSYPNFQYFHISTDMKDTSSRNAIFKIIISQLDKIQGFLNKLSLLLIRFCVLDSHGQGSRNEIVKIKELEFKWFSIITKILICSLVF